MLKLLIVDDHVLLRMGLAQFVRQVFPTAQITEAGDAAEALRQIRAREFDLILLDHGLPDRSGLAIMPDILAARPRARVLFLTGFAEKETALRALKSGAVGFLVKGAPSDELRKALVTVAQGGRHVSSELANELVFFAAQPSADSPVSSLSDREYQVLCLFGKGKTPTEIAQTLSLSIKTVSTYRSRLLEKLGLQSTPELVRYAVKQGLVE